MSRRALTVVSVLLAVSVFAPSPSAAQQGGPLEPPTTGGLPALLQELQFLGHNKRVLMIGAHPDDEDTELLVMLTRHEGAEAAYLSLTRGEGGQDLIGSELGEALGILRTEELLSARRIDGAQQFFSRAYDFGFSKTLDDTWAHWPKDSVLKDVVRIVRRFRPQIIVSVFSGTPRDGHGQHQAAGWAAQEAFRVAADPRRFPELKTEEGLDPWQATKLYRAARFDPTGRTLEFDGGQVEKLSGKTYHQLAMEGRSRHRSQDMGQLQEFGQSIGGVARLAPAGQDDGGGWEGFWSGVDTLLPASPAHFTALAAARAAAGHDPTAVYRALSQALASPFMPAGPERIRDQYREHLMRALAISGHLFFDVVADRDRLAVGDSLHLDLLGRFLGQLGPADASWRVLRDGRADARPPVRTGLATGMLVRTTATVRADAGLGVTTPYYLRAPRHGDLYTWPAGDPSILGLPRDPDPVIGELNYYTRLDRQTDTIHVESTRTASSRFRDQAFGEVRTPVMIVPRVSVKLTPTNAVVRASATGDARTISADVELESGTTAAISGMVTIEVPNGWGKPAPAPFSLATPGATVHLLLQIAVPTGAAVGQYELRAVATDAAGARYDIGAFMVEYPHIRPRQYTKPAVARVEVMDLTPPSGGRIAYVRGAADKVPEALAAAGLPVTLLDSAALTSGDLHQYDAIVIGPRAYEVDSAVVRNNRRLIDYARDGGRVIVQYQQQIYLEGSFAPYALGGNTRITDEHSPVTMLGATAGQSALAPAFTTPNAIGPSDWDGWIQERALYCPRTWGPEFHPLLSMNDPGEAPLQGCLLQASVGRGSYVYSGIAFFRELPAGVPGAYRLFFNLLGGRVTP